MPVKFVHVGARARWARARGRNSEFRQEIFAGIALHR